MTHTAHYIAAIMIVAATPTVSWYAAVGPLSSSRLCRLLTVAYTALFRESLSGLPWHSSYGGS